MRDELSKRRYRPRTNGTHKTVLWLLIGCVAAMLYVLSLSSLLQPQKSRTRREQISSVVEPTASLEPTTTDMTPPHPLATPHSPQKDEVDVTHIETEKVTPPSPSTTTPVPTPRPVVAPATTPPKAPKKTALAGTSAPQAAVVSPQGGSPDLNCAKGGLDLPTGKEHNVLEQPGGSEGEALEIRRTLSKANWPLKNHPQAVVWLPRHPPTTDLYTRCLLANQRELPLERSLTASHIQHVCGGVGNFSCSIAEYHNKLLQQRWPKWGKKCDDVYGLGLLRRFKESRHSMCEGEASTSSSSSSSKLQCKRVVAHISHEVSTSICQGQNVVVDYSKINDGDYPWLQFQEGAFDVRGGCRVSPFLPTDFIHCQADWMNLGLQGDRTAHDPPALRCDRVETTPTLFVTRSGDFSPFAMTHDWLNTVLLAAVEDFTPRNWSIVVMDRMGAGFYSPVWQYGFSPNHPVQWYPDLREKGERVCYTQMWFNIPARLSPIYNEDDCEGPSPLYLTYRDHILASFGALRVASVEETLVVTVIERRNYATGHSIGRRLGNLDKLLSFLRSRFAEEGIAARVNVVDYAAHTFGAQLNVSRATDVLVAMHGAGLAHVMFLHEWGGVFEFFCPEKPPSNFRYHQLSMKMGLRYDSFNIESEDNSIPVNQAGPQIVQLGRKVAEMKRKR